MNKLFNPTCTGLLPIAEVVVQDYSRDCTILILTLTARQIYLLSSNAKDGLRNRGTTTTSAWT